MASTGGNPTTTRDRSNVDENQPYVRQWLDVQDSEKKWFEAQITLVDHTQDPPEVTIKYKGFEDKWNERLPWGSERIAPLHTHTQPQYLVCRNVSLDLENQLDVLDSIDKWCQARIIDTDPLYKMVKVTYLGWNAKYDEWLNVDSYRLAPLHKHTPRIQAPVASRRERMFAAPNKEEKYRNDMERVLGLKVVTMGADGNCLFRSVSHQLYGTADFHYVVRAKVLDYMDAQRDFFSGFVDMGMDAYIRNMRFDGQWGGELEISAISELYGRPIEIYAYATEPRRQYPGRPGHRKYTLRLSYHFESHYNSIIDPKDAKEAVLRDRPGVFEDRVIAQLSTSAQLKRDIQDMRSGGVDAPRLAAVYQNVLDDDVEEAKRQSLAQHAQDEQKKIRAANAEDDLIEQVKRASLGVAGTDADLAAGIQQSMKAFEEQDPQIRAALEQSKLSHDQKMSDSLPGPIKQCVAMGFKQDAAEAAYTLFAQPDTSDDVIVNAMLEHLTSSGLS